MEFEQIAVHDSANFDLLRVFKDRLGHGDWIGDTVYATGVLRNVSKPSGYAAIENVAALWFNYSVVPGKEFELIHYTEGPNFLENQVPGGTSHFGMHVDSIKGHHEALIRRGFVLIQEVVTQHHASPAVKDRRYHYAIYHNMHSNFFWKLIERIERDDVRARTTAVLARSK